MPLQPTTPHADHDRLLVATYAAGDATGAELDRAIELVAACPDCAALHHDLRAIAAALPALPPPVRTRDFRLSPEQAASLRPSGLRRLLVPLAGPKFAFAAPLGTGLATLGVAGLLLAGSLGTPLANDLAGGGAPTPETAQAVAATEAPPIAPGEAGGQGFGPTALPSPGVRVAADPSMAPAPTAPLVERASEPARLSTAPDETAAPVAAPNGTETSGGSSAPWLELVRTAALLALATGLALAGLRLAAHRLP